MGTRTITGTLKRFDNTGWASAQINIELITDWATETAVAFPVVSQTFTTGLDGSIPAGVTLVTPSTGAWSYQCTIENNAPFTVLLEDGDDLTIDEFIALAGLGGSEVGVPQAEWLVSVYAGLADADAGDLLIADGAGDAAWGNAPAGFFMQRTSIGEGETVTIPAGRQMLVHGGLTVASTGALVATGDLVII